MSNSKVSEQFETVGLGEIVTDNYREYGNYVNHSRAIPGIDGLKPVFRRVLIAAYANARNSLVKTAKVTGDVIANWHPHGDACLDGNTKVYSVNGTAYYIKQLCEDGVTIDVFCFDEKTGTVVTSKAHSFRVGKEDTVEYELVFDGNITIKCTGNHPFLLASKKWIKAENIVKGSILLRATKGTDDIWRYAHAVVQAVNVTTRKVPKKYYDFTVDKYENMLLQTRYSPKDGMSFVCAHNSVVPVISSMVRANLLKGQGNHGATLLENLPMAAPRYTEVQFKQELADIFFKLVKYAPHYENELNNREPCYLITPIPIALITGSSGTGVGAHTQIPAFTYSSLLEAFTKDDPTLLKSSGDYRIVSADWNELWNTGRGNITFQYLVTSTFSQDDDGKVVTISGSGKNSIKPLMTHLNKWLNAGYIYIRNESKTGVSLVIGRTKGTRMISDEDVYQAAVKAATRRKMYDIKVTVNGTVRRLGIRTWISTTLALFNNSLNQWKIDEEQALRTKLLELSYVPKVAELLKQGKTNQEISDILQIDRSITNAVISKPISVLRKTNFDADIKVIEDKIADINAVSLDKILSAVSI